jgi:two-component system nitrate/nitrite response regulator NarL
MEQCVATIVIEPRLLVREALVSLIASHSYQIVGGVASMADIDNSLLASAPRLVILGPLPADEAARAADSIRKLWPEIKIILLFDRASSADLQTLLASEIDGCIPLFASPDTLVDTLQQIMGADIKVLVLKTEPCSMPSPTSGGEKGNELGLIPNNLARSDDARNGALDRAISRRIHHVLSEREEEILKGVVRGHSNKMIARTCGVTDATIKVHMKSILRKIRVANRTQAAIWALGQGYGGDANRRSLSLRSLHGLAAT